MKKHLLTIFFLLALILSACGSAAKSTSSTELSLAKQLIVGTFKLEGTQQEITAEKAKELLPLWQIYSEMIASDTAAQEEIDGLVAQIQETMTTEQVQAIKDMGLSQSDMVAVMQQDGGTTRSKIGSTSTPGDSGRDFGPPGGGGDFMGGGGGNQRQNSFSSQNSTSSASDAQSNQSSKLLSTLLEKLIALLEKKAQQ